jgi:hypothetical protein
MKDNSYRRKRSQSRNKWGEKEFSQSFDPDVTGADPNSDTEPIENRGANRDHQKKLTN